MLAPEPQSSFGSEEACAGAVSAQDGQVVSASLTGSPTTTSGDGYSYLSQGVTLTVSSASDAAAYTTTIYLVHEEGQWLVLGFGRVIWPHLSRKRQSQLAPPRALQP